MLAPLASIIAISLYLIASAILLVRARRELPQSSLWVSALVVLGLISHSMSIYSEMAYADGMLNLSLLHVASLMFWVMNLIVLIVGLSQPLHNLFLVQLPASALLVAAAQISSGNSLWVIEQPATMFSHIVLSILAYSLFIMATLHSLFMAFQNHQLKNKHPTGYVRLLPPLQTMESLFFCQLWVGEIFLLLAIITGFLYIDNLFAQHLAHKTVFSLLSFIIYGVLLWGRHQLGWRGTVAIRWALGGFSALMLAYFGSKFVLEVVLGISPGV